MCAYKSTDEFIINVFRQSDLTEKQRRTANSCQATDSCQSINNGKMNL